MVASAAEAARNAFVDVYASRYEVPQFVVQWLCDEDNELHQEDPYLTRSHLSLRLLDRNECPTAFDSMRLEKSVRRTVQRVMYADGGALGSADALQSAVELCRDCPALMNDTAVQIRDHLVKTVQALAREPGTLTSFPQGADYQGGPACYPADLDGQQLSEEDAIRCCPRVLRLLKDLMPLISSSSALNELDYLYLLLSLLACRDGAISAASESVLYPIIEKPHRQSDLGDVAIATWQRIRSLINESEVDTDSDSAIAYALWTKLLIQEDPFQSRQDILEDSAYWRLLQIGLQAPRSILQKQSLYILMKTLPLIRQDIRCSKFSYSPVQHDALYESWSTFATIFTTLVLDHDIEQIKVTLPVTLSLMLPGCAVHGSWLAALFGAILRHGHENARHEVVVFLLDHVKQTHIIFLRDEPNFMQNDFLPCATTTRLLKSSITVESGVATSEYGERLTTFIESLFISVSVDDTGLNPYSAQHKLHVKAVLRYLHETPNLGPEHVFVLDGLRLGIWDEWRCLRMDDAVLIASIAKKSVESNPGIALSALKLSLNLQLDYMNPSNLLEQASSFISGLEHLVSNEILQNFSFQFERSLDDFPTRAQAASWSAEQKALCMRLSDVDDGPSYRNGPLWKLLSKKWLCLGDIDVLAIFFRYQNESFAACLDDAIISAFRTHGQTINGLLTETAEKIWIMMPEEGSKLRKCLDRYILLATNRVRVLFTRIANESDDVSLQEEYILLAEFLVRFYEEETGLHDLAPTLMTSAILNYMVCIPQVHYFERDLMKLGLEHRSKLLRVSFRLLLETIPEEFPRLSGGKVIPCKGLAGMLKDEAQYMTTELLSSALDWVYFTLLNQYFLEDIVEILEPLWQASVRLDHPRPIVRPLLQVFCHHRTLLEVIRSPSLSQLVASVILDMAKLTASRSRGFADLMRAVRMCSFFARIPQIVRDAIQEIVCGFARDGMVANAELKLEAASNAKMKIPGSSIEERPYPGDENLGYAYLFDMLNRLRSWSGELAKHGELAKAIFDEVFEPWASQKPTSTVVSKWKKPIQLQILLILLDSKLARTNEAETRTLLGSLVDTCFLEKEPLYRLPLEWLCARIVLSRPIFLEVLLLKLSGFRDATPTSVASVVRSAVMVAKYNLEQFTSQLMSSLVQLATSPKVIIQKESQRGLSYLWEMAVARKWTTITANSILKVMCPNMVEMRKEYDTKLARQQEVAEPELYAAKVQPLEFFDIIKNLNLTGIVYWTQPTKESPGLENGTLIDVSAFDDDILDLITWDDEILDASIYNNEPDDIYVGALPLGNPLPPPAAPSQSPPLAPVSSVPPPTTAHGPLQTKSQSWHLPPSSSIPPPPHTLIILASFVSDPHNLGGLARASEVHGAQALLVAHLDRLRASPAFKALAVSAASHLPIVELAPDVASVTRFLAEKKREGWGVVGVEQTDRSRVLGEGDGGGGYRFPERCVLVLGAERGGVPAWVLGECDECVMLRQWGRVRSMNVQTAAAVVMYEWTRQWGKR